MSGGLQPDPLTTLRQCQRVNHSHTALFGQRHEQPTAVSRYGHPKRIQGRADAERSNVTTGEAAQAYHQRSDVSAVPAVGIVPEAMVALVLADANESPIE
jgi:hypothetical protein